MGDVLGVGAKNGVGEALPILPPPPHSATTRTHSLTVVDSEPGVKMTLCVPKYMITYATVHPLALQCRGAALD